MAKRKIRVGLIGCGGNMRGAHIPRLKADGSVELVAVADTGGGIGAAIAGSVGS